MEKKKKRDKSSLNNTETEGGDNQQKEGENQGGVTLAKRFYKVGSPVQENVTGAHHQSPTILQWPYTQQPSAEQSLQFPIPSSQVQQPQPQPLARHQSQPSHPHPNPHPHPHQHPHAHPHQHQHQHQQQQQVHHGHQGVLQQGQPQIQQQSVPYWPHPEFPATVPPPGPFYPFPPGSNDSNWQATAYSGAHAANEHATPYGYQGGYAYPVGYPGPWDPAAWWAHSHQQTPYPYPYPPYGGGYGYMAPPAPPTPGSTPSGAFQRGIIRPPAGLSQKHQRLWEAQSMENVQLWCALARAESEIAAYRGRLMKLESDVFALKAHHDAAADGSAVANIATQNPRKGRNKRSIGVTTTLPASDNFQPRSRGRKVTTCRMVTEEKDKNDNEKDKESKPEEKDKLSIPVITVHPPNLPVAEEEQEKVQPMFTNGSEFELDKNKSRLNPDFPTAAVCNNHVFSNDADNLQYSTISINQISAFGTPLPATERKENGNEHTADRKGPLAGPTQNLNNFLENKISESGEESSASYRGVNNRVNGWSSAAPAGDGVRNMVLESRMHPFYDQGHVMRSDTMRGGKMLSAWGYVCEDNSEEQDDVVPSGKEEEDEEMEEEGDSALEEGRRPKGEGILRLNSASGIPKGLTQMNRW